jgi:hypothetical protein
MPIIYIIVGMVLMYWVTPNPAQTACNQPVQLQASIELSEKTLETDSDLNLRGTTEQNVIATSSSQRPEALSSFHPNFGFENISLSRNQLKDLKKDEFMSDCMRYVQNMKECERIWN